MDSCCYIPYPSHSESGRLLARNQRTLQSLLAVLDKTAVAFSALINLARKLRILLSELRNNTVPLLRPTIITPVTFSINAISCTCFSTFWSHFAGSPVPDELSA